MMAMITQNSSSSFSFFSLDGKERNKPACRSAWHAGEEKIKALSSPFLRNFFIPAARDSMNLQRTACGVISSQARSFSFGCSPFAAHQKPDKIRPSLGLNLRSVRIPMTYVSYESLTTNSFSRECSGFKYLREPLITTRGDLKYSES
jgi:hypothetical protein